MVNKVEYFSKDTYVYANVFYFGVRVSSSHVGDRGLSPALVLSADDDYDNQSLLEVHVSWRYNIGEVSCYTVGRAVMTARCWRCHHGVTRWRWTSVVAQRQRIVVTFRSWNEDTSAKRLNALLSHGGKTAKSRLYLNTIRSWFRPIEVFIKFSLNFH